MARDILSHIRINNTSDEVSLVFIHGSTMTKEGMEPFARYFMNYNCVCFDLTAHGDSKGVEPSSIAEFASDVEYSITELQKQGILTDKIILLGYSMGGAIVCEIGIRKTINVSGIVILSSGGDLKSNTPLVDSIKDMPIEQFKTENILEFLFGVDTSADEESKIKDLFLETKARDEVGYQDLMVSNAYNQIHLCGDIDVPTYIVHGSADNIVLPNAAIVSCNVIKDSKILIVPKKGHAAIFENSSFISEEICKFIDEL